VLEERNSSDEFIKLFAYGNYIDELLLSLEVPSPGYPLSPTYLRTYVHDHLYSPVAFLHGITGNCYERYEYDVYGNPHIMSASYEPRETSNYGNCYLFTGRRVDILDDSSLKIQYSRFRYYDYYIGRWLEHDPFGIIPNSSWPNNFSITGQYVDSLNLYEYVQSKPLEKTDPFGLAWKIERNNGQYATAEVELSPDTIANLAPKIGLEVGQFKKWLTFVNNKIKTLKGKKTLIQLKSTDKICTKEKVKIPNLVLAYWAGWGGGIGKHFVDWGYDVGDLEQRGFFVLEDENQTANSFELTIELFQATKKLHGIYAWGHGNKEGFLTHEKYNGNSEYYSSYSSWAPKYKMALGIIWACYSGDGGASPYFSSNGIFRGHAGKLIPLPLHAYGPRVKSIVPPGAQGTKK